MNSESAPQIFNGENYNLARLGGAIMALCSFSAANINSLSSHSDLKTTETCRHIDPRYEIPIANDTFLIKHQAGVYDQNYALFINTKQKIVYVAQEELDAKRTEAVRILKYAKSTPEDPQSVSFKDALPGTTMNFLAIFNSHPEPGFPNLTIEPSVCKTGTTI